MDGQARGAQLSEVNLPPCQERPDFIYRTFLMLTLDRALLDKRSVPELCGCVLLQGWNFGR